MQPIGIRQFCRADLQTPWSLPARGAASKFKKRLEALTLDVSGKLYNVEQVIQYGTVVPAEFCQTIWPQPMQPPQLALTRSCCASSNRAAYPSLTNLVMMCHILSCFITRGRLSNGGHMMDILGISQHSTFLTRENMMIQRMDWAFPKIFSHPTWGHCIFFAAAMISEAVLLGFPLFSPGFRPRFRRIP